VLAKEGAEFNVASNVVWPRLFFVRTPLVEKQDPTSRPRSSHQARMT